MYHLQECKVFNGKHDVGEISIGVIKERRWLQSNTRQQRSKSQSPLSKRSVPRLSTKIMLHVIVIKGQSKSPPGKAILIKHGGREYQCNKRSVNFAQIFFFLNKSSVCKHGFFFFSVFFFFFRALLHNFFLQMF